MRIDAYATLKGVSEKLYISRHTFYRWCKLRLSISNFRAIRGEER